MYDEGMAGLGSDLCVMVLCRLWLNGDMFDPDRFRDGTAGDQHPLAFIPFGFGTRMCLGYR